jgi:hypothetical protein
VRPPVGEVAADSSPPKMLVVPPDALLVASTVGWRVKLFV